MGRRDVGAWWALAVLVVALAVTMPVAAAPPRTVVFVLLDTTRADRLSAWGNPRATSPQLDALAAEGVRFAQHFANAHATRSSMPQLMSGRYFRPDLLLPFRTTTNPREYVFSRRDPTAVLLPGVLHERGWQVRGVSAHPWVVVDSELGRTFDSLELVPFKAEDGHGDAAQVVDRALELWRARDPQQPLFLYLHLMDMHLPRRVPPGGIPFPTDPAAAARFDAQGLPRFHPSRRVWDDNDATDFLPGDVAYVTALYDARIAWADRQLGRVFAAVRAADPTLAQTLIVVTADHGEELGEDGRTGHHTSLADAIHHVPWIMAGGGIESGQVSQQFSEHVDVVPTVLRLLGEQIPDGVWFSGRPRIDRSGRIDQDGSTRGVYYAWETYRAMRTERFLLREIPEAAPEAHCTSPRQLYAATGTRRRPLEAAGTPVTTDRMAKRLAHRLERQAQAFQRSRFATPSGPFGVDPEYFLLDDGPAIGCAPVGADARRWPFWQRGWLWTDRGVLLRSGESSPLRVRLAAPEGRFEARVRLEALAPMPWLIGFNGWLRQSFRHQQPGAWASAGVVDARGGTAVVEVPTTLARGKHLVEVQLAPLGMAPATGDGLLGPEQEEQRRRLKALGYIN